MSKAIATTRDVTFIGTVWAAWAFLLLAAIHPPTEGPPTTRPRHHKGNQWK